MTTGDEDQEVVLPRVSHAQILEKQEQERKEFKKRVERIKSAIPKKDRAGRMRAAEDAEEEERRLLRAQAEERLEMGIEDKVAQNEADSAPQEQVAQSAPAGKSESKAARRRRKKAQQEAEAQRRIDDEKAAMGPSPKFLETQAIDSQLKPKNLRIHPIAADGHCLYSAVAHQMEINEFSSAVPASVYGLRTATADFLMAHKSEYIPFIETLDGDEALFVQYCEKLRNEAEWGGQVELKALAELLGAEIEVYAAGLPVVKMGEASATAPTFRVSFHRQYLGLGEHYNSVVPFS